MKYTKKHSFALLFAALLTASSLTAYGETEMTVTNVVPNETIATETEPETTDIDLLPEADYEGFGFHILSTDPDCLWGWRVSIYAEEEIGALHENSMGNVISPYFNAIRSSGTEKLASTAASTRKAFETALTKLEETYAGLE